MSAFNLPHLLLLALLAPGFDPIELPGGASAIDLDFEAEAGRLSGTLFLPPGEGPFPAVIFITGSGGGSYRRSWDGEHQSYFWPELQAWFQGRGYAVFIYDKPGVGLSEGDWRRERFDGRARNAMAALRTIAARPDIDAGRIGLLGHSQGGWIAVMAAARHPTEIDFVITLAGPAIGVRQQVMEDMSNRWECERRSLAGLRQTGLGVALSALGGISRIMPAGYLSRIVRYDPAEDLAGIGQPMLALFATHDIMVMPETNVPRLEQHFGHASGNDHLFVETIIGLDHVFRYGELCPGGSRPGTFAAEFWEALAHPAFWRVVSRDTPE